MTAHSYSVIQDWKTNFIKGKIIMTLFRIAHLATLNRIIFIIMIPYLVLYRIIVEWILCIEIPYKLKVGKGLRIAHAQALVIHDSTVIGNNCTIRQCTTIGKKLKPNGNYSLSPKIGNNVDIGANVCIIGDVTIGDNAIIGAGTVIVKSIPANTIAVGNPARIIKSRQ